jgi:hypothetical protein
MLRLTEMTEERELLRKCMLGNQDARETFSTRSYRRETQMAVRSVLMRAAAKKNLSLPDDEIEAFAVATMAWLFSRWQDLPSRLYDLHRVIRTVVTGKTKNYWKRRRKTLKMKT